MVPCRLLIEDGLYYLDIFGMEALYLDADKTYVMILRDSISNKVHVLEKLMELTRRQGELARSGNPDVREFDDLLDEKGQQIDMLNMLDDGFVSIYEKVKDEITDNAAIYKSELLEIRKMIDRATDIGVRLEALEHENKQYIETFIANKKAEVKNFKQSKNMTASYAKNMTNQNAETTSYFMDKKK